MQLKLSRYYSYLLRVLPYLIYFFPALIYSFFIRNDEKYKNIWLISDRGDEARDNGYHLFRYIMKNKKGINAYFVITNNSPDKNKVNIYGNNIETGSFKHFLYFILADKLISSHIYGAAPNGRACLPFLYILNPKKHVHLKHGITQNNIKLNDKNQNIVVCASDLEIKNLQSSSKEIREAVRTIGFCRYDNLIDKSVSMFKKQILIMPTFRLWLEDASRLPNRDDIFKNDDYFIWNRLLNNEKLLEFLEFENIKLIFYPHYRIQKYIHNFTSKSENVIIANKQEFDIQELLINSSLMITDYSSVFFDFAYMKKPVIYFQFDKEKFRKKHYAAGSFVYERDGFGPVYDNIDEVVKFTIQTIKGSFVMEKTYLNTLEGFFNFNDTNNCQRNYDAILNLDINKKVNKLSID